MAAQVLSGSGNVSYTNSTGQNVRLVINYLELGGSSNEYATVTFGGVEVRVSGKTKLGKTLSYITPLVENNRQSNSMFTENTNGSCCPTEIALANGQTFAIGAATLGSSTEIKGYNIIIIPEAG